MINVVFLPLNLIASIGGMSELTMMTHGVPWWVSYPLFCLAIGLVGFATAIVLRRMSFKREIASPKRGRNAKQGTSSHDL
ncbi:MAG: hypothetical protein L0H73_05520 [Nitrococcus sp.]|nr:hypothetical protein [Nitrococcus sp.]